MHKLSVLCFLVFTCCWFNAPAQVKSFTKTGKITFFSHAPLEDIEAANKTAAAVADTKTGALQVIVLMRGFEFKKALMQEHFNENYVESHRYPKAELKGSFLNNADIDYNKEGIYKTIVKGQLSLHGVTKEVTVPVILEIRGRKIEATSVFSLLLSDYHIAIPAIVKDKISNSVKVTVDLKLDPLGN